MKKDYRDILNLIYALHCCEDKESFLNALMSSLIHVFHADCVTFHLIQGFLWQIKIVESRSFKSDKLNVSEDKYYPRLYKDSFYLKSPLLKEEQSVIWPRERIVKTQSNLKYRVECFVIRKSAALNPEPNFVVTLNQISPEQVQDATLQAVYNLSQRELDIIHYLNQRLTYSEIGQKLFISKETVPTHTKNIYRKLGAKNRLDLYRYTQQLCRSK